MEKLQILEEELVRLLKQSELVSTKLGDKRENEQSIICDRIDNLFILVNEIKEDIDYIETQVNRLIVD
jgi:hypothetical protein